MSNHWQLHAMTSLYAPLIIKPKSEEENSALATKIKESRKKFQDHLSIQDDSSGEAINNMNPDEWVITNLAYPTNFLPRGTVFQDIPFIPTDIPDFRKIELSASDFTETNANTLKSTAVKSRIHDTINKHEIKSILTSITGNPIISTTKDINDAQPKTVIASGLARFLQSSSSEGTSDFNVNDLKLEIVKKIRTSGLKPNVINHLIDSVDDAFKEIDVSKIVANKRKVEDTYIYIVEKLLWK